MEWVAYYIGVGVPSTDEWIGGGYFTEEGIGTVFYIEWMIDGVYDEITASGVSFGEQYWVDIYRPVSGGVDGDTEGWSTNVWDSEWNLILHKNCPTLPINEEASILPFSFLA